MKLWHGSNGRGLGLLLLISFISRAESGSTYWEKTKNGLGLIRDLVFRVGHQTENHQRQGLQLISGGFPRTGTKSIEEALTALGHRVYDTRAMLAHDHFEAWTLAAKEWKQHNNLEPMRDMTLLMEQLGYSATLDIPMNLLAPALIQVRPSAKVLWNYRAKGSQNWYESFCFINWFAEPLFYGRPWKWIFPNPSDKMKSLLATISPVFSEGLSYPQHFDRPVPWYDKLKDNRHPLETNGQLKMQWTGFYQAFPRILQSTLRKLKGGGNADDDTNIDSQYLAYTVQEGWGPLLKFLDVDDQYSELAKQPFPHVNDRSMLITIAKVMAFLGVTFPLWVLLMLYSTFALVRGLVRFLVPGTNTGSKQEGKSKQE